MRKEVEGREEYKKYLERKDAERKQGELAEKQNMRVGDLIRTQQDKDRKWAEKILRMKDNGENVRDTEVERARNILNRK